MSRLKNALIVIVIFLIAAGATIATNAELKNKFFSDLRSFKDFIDLKMRAHFFAAKKESTQKRIWSSAEPVGKKKPQGTTEEPGVGDEVALYFKDGSAMVGELIAKTKDEYIIKWKGQETVVYAGQVDHMGTPQEALEAKKNLLSDEEIARCWPYNNDVVVRLTNKVVLDGRITNIGKNNITLAENVEGGGSIEQDVAYPKIDYLIFKPVNNDESKNIENMLKKLFPKMEFYKDGNFTLVTDSDINWAKEYIATLRGVYTDAYFKFFDLFKDRKPKTQNFVVMFDDYADFVEYAIADGVPGWLVAGYFNPDEEVLYLFNVLGERFSKILFEGWVGESGREIDEIVDTVGDQFDDRYRIFIEDEAKVIKDKYWKAYTYYKGMFRDATLSTLRHEFAHELFYNWGLQNIVLSRASENRDALIAKKKEFLETKDYKKKAELVRSLMAMHVEEWSGLDMRAANSWLAEGIATYCEKRPLGGQNDRWVFLYQQMVKEGSIYPLESLTVYKMGSFPGISARGMLYSYAQSWAFVTFLMDRYPKEFMEYQRRMTSTTAKGFEDITWLVGATGKDIRTLEAEFTDYMKRFGEVEDPDVNEFMNLYNIFNE